jgi:hypothetical protein
MINNPRHSLVHHSEAVPTIVVADDGSTTIAEELRVGAMGCELRNCCARIVIRTRVKQLFSGFGDALDHVRLRSVRPSLPDLCATSIRNAHVDTKDDTIRAKEFPHRWVWSLHGWGAGAGKRRNSRLPFTLRNTRSRLRARPGPRGVGKSPPRNHDESAICAI